ncbi:DNA double-strand break repair nuclease NurA [Candidatus Woesearchaeota archaeon]|nr:DNA double-strand break repair nuclease NurA [Candidatus Woesearchaeota archaeon]
MHKEIVEKVVEKIGEKLKATGRFVQFSDQSYSAAEFSSDNFRKIPDSTPKSKIAFIDGGNNTILEAASFSLQLLRVYYAVYSENKKRKTGKNEFFALASASNLGDDLVFDIDVFGKNENFNSVSAFDRTLAKGSHRVNASEVVLACRKIAELRQALKLADELEQGDVIVLDRDLEASVTGEKEVMDELYAKADEKNIIICGISKTTRLFTDTGDSASAVISSIAPEGAWVYRSVAEVDNEKHKAEICFVKLHPKSKYVFRFEIYKKQKDEAGKVLALLKNNAKDPVFLGYPYGLIEADRFARISNNEAEYYKVMLMSKAGKDSARIMEYIKSVDAHSILDNIT